MIDWINLIANALWILGCALGLAAISYASWEASIQHEKLSARLKESQYQIALNLAGFLFCLGLAGTAQPVWQMILWLVLGVFYLVMTGAEIRSKRKEGHTGPNQAQ